MKNAHATQQTLFDEELLIPDRQVLDRLADRGIVLGTSGFSYEDWKGVFYPHRTRKADMLGYYAQYFPSTELNFSYYSVPDPRTMHAMTEKAPGMKFSLKAHGSLTHEQRLAPDIVTRVGQSAKALAQEESLSALLFQFPYSFKNSPENREYLQRVLDPFLADFNCVIEFRFKPWLTDEIFKLCERLGATLCSIDAPKLPGLIPEFVQPGKNFSYYRLHGRNKDMWFDGDNESRYDYHYSTSELEEIAKNVIYLWEQSELVYVLGNNHPRGEAISAMMELSYMLIERLTKMK
ncbi:MAG: hypothetical protein CL946_13730 [Ectothiorhodospiraceae bacterium]|nr:hypothetical protein [Ectothiorhodospiraceae bacterium]